MTAVSNRIDSNQRTNRAIRLKQGLITKGGTTTHAISKKTKVWTSLLCDVKRAKYKGYKKQKPGFSTRLSE
jgi:hypothetical protein